MNTVAIFGVGLIGGSFALALRKAGFGGRIVGVSSEETVRRALALGVIDETLGPEEAARSADLLYLAQPISRILDILRELDAWVRPDALITDAGSTKSAIVQRASETISRCQFVGGHPMAGREQRGVDAADPVLFRGRPYVLTPRSPSELDTPQVRGLMNWIERIGAIPIRLDPQEHDRIVAYTSHLPQLASTALGALLAGRSEPRSRVFGPALIDSTRLALSSFEIWGDIVATNRDQIRAALERYCDTIQMFAQALEQDPEALRAYFRRAEEFASQLRETP